MVHCFIFHILTFSPWIELHVLRTWATFSTSFPCVVAMTASMCALSFSKQGSAYPLFWSRFTFSHSESLFLSINMYIPKGCVVTGIVTNIPSFMRLYSSVWNIWMGAELFVFQFWHSCCWQIFWEFFYNYLASYFSLGSSLPLNNFLLWGYSTVYIGAVASLVFGRKEKKSKSAMKIKWHTSTFPNSFRKHTVLIP